MRNNNKVYMIEIYKEIDGNYFEIEKEEFFTQQYNIAKEFCKLKEKSSGLNKDGKFVRYECKVNEFDFKTNAEVIKMINDLKKEI